MKTNKLLYLPFYIVLITACAKSPSTSTGDPVIVLKKINEITSSQLGIGLRELNEFTRMPSSDIILTSENSFKPDALSNLKVLEAAGYITISISSDSKETGFSNTKFYKIQRTTKGLELKNALSAF